MNIVVQLEDKVRFVMGKEVRLFKSEERQRRVDVGAFLHQLADKIAEGQVVLRQGTNELALQLPQNVVLEVVDTAPEMKGATATKRPKPAKLSTGIEILVPEYISNGEKVTVNTTTGEFAGRA